MDDKRSSATKTNPSGKAPPDQDKSTNMSVRDVSYNLIEDIINEHKNRTTTAYEEHIITKKFIRDMLKDIPSEEEKTKVLGKMVAELDAVPEKDNDNTNKW